jgi:hypothetical protein
MPRTQLSEQQIRFSEVFSIEKILESKGFSIIKKGDLAKTLI